MRQLLKNIWLFIRRLALPSSLRGGTTKQSNLSCLGYFGSGWIAALHCVSLAMTAVVLFITNPISAHPTDNPEHWLNIGTDFYFEGQQDSAKVYLEQVFLTDTDEKMTAARYLLDIAIAQGDTPKINEYALFLADNYDLSLNQERKHARQRYLLIGAGALLGLLVMGWVLLRLRKTNNQQRRAYDQEREAFDQQLNEAQSAIERQTFENLQRQAREVLSRGSQRKRILEAFNATYPKAYERLKATYPDLSEQEYDLLILNFLEFRIKEEAEILELSQNTVMKYRSNLLKKVGKDPVSAVLNAMPTS
jgi:hypothetical protein